MKNHTITRLYFLLCSMLLSTASCFAIEKTQSTCAVIPSVLSKQILQSPDRVIALPGYGCVKHIELAGYLPASESGELFYWFIASRSNPAIDPLVIWLNGGPGSSSLYGFLLENGPYRVNQNQRLSIRQEAWTAHSNYMIIDQPAGVGFSLAKNNHPVKNEDDAIAQLYDAIQAFFQRYPELAKSPLYLSGESYAGKY